VYLTCERILNTSLPWSGTMFGSKTALMEVALDRFLKMLHIATDAIEVLVSVALVVLAGGVLLSLGVEMWGVASAGQTLTTQVFNRLVGIILEVFILVELFRIAIAYMKHENVIPTVLEAALVAVARKFVVYEGGENYLQTTVGLSALLLAVAVSWWMLARSNACELRT
jgi:uncharacterized membrane protein (DUF373 family)